MSQIEELQRRIVAAMERIGAGVDVLGANPAEPSGQDEALKAALDDEKVANAQLEERLKSLKQRHEQEVDAMRADMENLRAAPVEDQLKAAINGALALEEENARLRSELADSERVAELSAELEMLRAERSSHGAAMSRLDDDLQRMRKANKQLRQTVDELRSASQSGMPDAELLNRATVAELEATRAAQATDAAEAHAVLARLEPLLSRAKLAEGEVE